MLSVGSTLTLYRYHPRTGQDAEDFGLDEICDHLAVLIAEAREQGARFYWFADAEHILRVDSRDFIEKLGHLVDVVLDELSKPPALEVDPRRYDVCTDVYIRIGTRDVDVGHLTGESFLQWLREDDTPRRAEVLACVALGYPLPVYNDGQEEQASDCRH